MSQKLLIIRFSSFGDIVQALDVPAAFMKQYPEAEIHWLVRSDFKDLLENHPQIQQVHAFERKEGLKGLLKLAQKLNSENFTHVYDAHSNIRSRIVSQHVSCDYFVRRPKNRWKRLLMFRFGQKTLPSPFVGRISFLYPLKKWDIQTSPDRHPHFFIPPEALEKVQDLLPTNPITLVPSAAWEMKRWPLDSWAQLMESLPQENFVILGGPQDQDIMTLVGSNITNLVGKLSLIESCAVIRKSKLVIANDTGLMHVSDQMKIPTLCLIGPTAFGYPGSASSRVIETRLSCKPCTKDGRGKCKNKIYQKCLTDITPEHVIKRFPK